MKTHQLRPVANYRSTLMSSDGTGERPEDSTFYDKSGEDLGTHSWVPTVECDKAFMTAPLKSNGPSWPPASFSQVQALPTWAAALPSVHLHTKGQSDHCCSEHTPFQTHKPLWGLDQSLPSHTGLPGVFLSLWPPAQVSPPQGGCPCPHCLKISSGGPITVCLF